MAFWANPADTMAIYALSNQFGLHTSVITNSKLWTTVTPEFQGTEWDVLDISPIKLLYMGANRFGQIWKKAVPDQPSFYGPNFNYQPMLSLTSVPSTDNVETACTLVQISDNVSQYLQSAETTTPPMFEGPEVTIEDDTMDKIVGKYDVCMWKPSLCTDAMDQIVRPMGNVSVNVEMKTAAKITNVLKVETKRCSVKLVRLDSILFGDMKDSSTLEENIAKQQTSSQMPTGPPRLCPKNKANRPTRLPRNASKNKQYMEEPGSSSPTRDRKGFVKNIKSSTSGPSDDRAQTQRSEPPSFSLPALPSPEVDPYDADTEVESDVTVETPPKSNSQPITSTPKKGTISITQHALKRKATPRRYKCKECSIVLESVHELTTHHQTNHNILYCSTCKRPFNNPMSLSRHEYEHKKKNLPCPKCDRTFTFESQVKAHMYSYRSKPSFFCLYPKCRKGFFNDSDLTRHAKRHDGRIYQCIDCPYHDTDKRNYDSYRLSHSRIAKYKCEACNKEFVFNTQKRRHLKDGKCPIKHSGSPTF